LAGEAGEVGLRVVRDRSTEKRAGTASAGKSRLNRTPNHTEKKKKEWGKKGNREPVVGRKEKIPSASNWGNALILRVKSGLEKKNKKQKDVPVSVPEKRGIATVNAARVLLKREGVDESEAKAYHRLEEKTTDGGDHAKKALKKMQGTKKSPRRNSQPPVQKGGPSRFT